MTIHILRSPPLPVSFPNLFVLSLSPPSSSSPPRQISPAAFGSLFIGISIALMLFGSATFIIRFILMPLVITLVMYSMLLNLFPICRRLAAPFSVRLLIPVVLPQVMKIDILLFPFFFYFCHAVQLFDEMLIFFFFISFFLCSVELFNPCFLGATG
ncbi:hypothetical protein PHJA_000300200 [Phtheirospermum japonicum]|uniref:Uncharacterized protein n=1 Tax=Phtheirospermum japonicum TaxID=374723 RepID=A0A830B8H9_9LAMI|nr:hypothetical protein PHJA_000300200 [Phtheirospermum japonicum]